MSAPIMSETRSCKFLKFKIGIKNRVKTTDAIRAVQIVTAKVASELDPSTRMIGAT